MCVSVSVCPSIYTQPHITTSFINFLHFRAGFVRCLTRLYIFLIPFCLCWKWLLFPLICDILYYLLFHQIWHVLQVLRYAHINNTWFCSFLQFCTKPSFCNVACSQGVKLYPINQTLTIRIFPPFSSSLIGPYCWESRSSWWRHRLHLPSCPANWGCFPAFLIGVSLILND